MEIAGSVFGFADSRFGLLPEHQRPKDRWDLVPPGFVTHLEMTDERQPDDHADHDVGEAYFDAEARLRWCDARGIDVQFLNPTFLVGAFVQAGRVRRFDLIDEIRRAWNTWATTVTAGHEERLVPVTQIDLDDIEWSTAEMARMRTGGARRSSFPRRRSPRGARARRSPGASPTPTSNRSGTPRRTLAWRRSPTWASPVERINPGWANNGRDDVQTFNVLNAVANNLGPQLLLAAMAFDGVLERHPKLNIVVEEVGVDWLPHLVGALDAAIGRKPEVLVDDEYRPSNLVLGETYTLPLTPVEYLRRQVRVTPLPRWHPIAPVLRSAVPPELLCFSSDYPHVEGASDAVAPVRAPAGAFRRTARDDVLRRRGRTARRVDPKRSSPGPPRTPAGRDSRRHLDSLSVVELSASGHQAAADGERLTVAVRGLIAEDPGCHRRDLLRCPRSDRGRFLPPWRRASRRQSGRLLHPSSLPATASCACRPRRDRAR